MTKSLNLTPSLYIEFKGSKRRSKVKGVKAKMAVYGDQAMYVYCIGQNCWAVGYMAIPIFPDPYSCRLHGMAVCF